MGNSILYNDAFLLNVSRQVLACIDEGTTKAVRPERAHYLGMSGIGGCAAEQWRAYHGGAGASTIEPSLQRIFDLGNAIEDLVVRYIEASEGVEILSTQAEYSDFDGRLRGHSDLVLSVDGMKVVADVKSMSQRNFDWLKSVGFKTSHWKYYCQLMMYAGYEGADAIQIIAYNKDNSDIITQTMPYDESCFEMLRARAMMILDAPSEPPCERGNGRVKWCSCGQNGKLIEKT